MFWLRRHPVARGEVQHEPFVESAPGAIVEVFEGGRLAQLRLVQPCLQPPVVALGCFPVDEQAKPLFEGERVDVRGLELLAQCACHAREAEVLEFVEGGMIMHGQFFPWLLT